jgi:glycosyltransferase involved in cell wall biosynthesis
MEGMRACGHEVALFSMADPRGSATPFDKYLMPSTDFKSARGMITKTRLAVQAIYSVAARTRIRAMIKAFRPDVAHVRNIYHHLSPSILWELKAQGVPVVYHVNDFKMLCPTYNMVGASGEACERCAGGNFKNAVIDGCYTGGRAAASVLAAEAYFHRWLRTYEKCVDLVLAPSHFVMNQFVHNGWRPSKIQVLQHFQDLPARVQPHPGVSAHILYLGRLSQEKGVSDLISAMRHLPELKLVVAGDGPQRAELERAISLRSLRNVSLAGQLSGKELESLIANSQFTVFPSHAYETFGKSITESYAQARAVVASDLGSRRELVKPEKTGLLYKPGDVDGLVAAIRILQKHPLLSKQMGEAGWELVRDKHSRVQHFLALQKTYQHFAEKAQVRTVPRAEPLRVAFIGGRGVVGKYSGVESCYEQTGARMAAKGHEITVYCRNYFTPKIAEYKRMRIVRLPTIRTKHLDTLVHTLLSTAHACFTGCDIVHYQTLGPSLFSLFPRLIGKRTLVTVQGLDWQRKKWSWIARLALKLSEYAAARLPNQTIVVSRALEERFRLRHQKQTRFVPNGAELRERTPSVHLRQLGLTSGKYVLFTGRLSPEKNCDLLIDAFENLHTDVKLAFAGGSSQPNAYASQLRKRQSERVVFLDWISGDVLTEVLTNAAIFVLPSDIEGMSLALLDAMGAGVCVLANDIPENREAIGDAGFVFKRGDRLELQRMLALLLSDDTLRALSGIRGKQRVRENYLWDDVTERIEKVYRDLNGEGAVETASVTRIAAGKIA